MSPRLSSGLPPPSPLLLLLSLKAFPSTVLPDSLPLVSAPLLFPLKRLLLRLCRSLQKLPQLSGGNRASNKAVALLPCMQRAKKRVSFAAAATLGAFPTAPHSGQALAVVDL